MASRRKRSALVEAELDYSRSYTDYDYSDEEFEAVDEESRARAVAFVESKYRYFVETNADTLATIEDAICTSLSEVWATDRVYVGLRAEPYEQATLLDLIQTENKVLNKILAALGALCLEARLLRAEAQTDVYASLALHGEALTGDEERDDGDTQIQMGRLLPLLQSMCVFVRRCYAVVVNFVHQLASLYTGSQRFFSVAAVRFREVFAALGEVLAVLITIEELVRQNAALRDGWAAYRRMIATMRNDPEMYESDAAELDALARLLGDIELTLFDDQIVDNALRQTFDFEDRFVVTTNALFRAEFEWALGAQWSYLMGRIGTASETTERGELVGFMGLFALFHTVYPDAATPALCKAIWDLHATVPLVHLYGAVVLFPTEFMQHRLPDKIAGRLAELKQARATYLKTLSNDLPAIVYGLYLQTSTWMVRLETNLAKTASLDQVIDTRTALLLRGLVLAANIAQVFHTTMGMYAKLRKPLTPSRIRALCQLVELLKCIELTFIRRTRLIAESLGAIVQQLSLGLERMFLPAKHELEDSRLVSNASLDALAGLNLVVAMLEGPTSEQRRLALRLGLAVALQKPILKADAHVQVEAQLRKIELLTALNTNVRALCSCEFFFWSRVLLPAYLRDALERPIECYRVRYMFAALQDVAALLHKVEQFNGNVSVEAFRKETMEHFETCFLKPLSSEVEIELRLLCHTELLVHRPTPFEGRKRDLAPFFRAKPIAFVGKSFSIAQRVAQYLESAFYDITAVSLQDWTVYEEMRSLAAKKWGLELADSHLQGHSQQARLDVLVIMRNIAVFVERYDYNLNAQMFVERISTSKQLNSIDIAHIAASIRTHGPGVLNTAVNFVYQYLKDRLRTFSVFLFDDQIRSRLMRDARYFERSRAECGNIFPYERADAFNRDIRTLGTTDGLSYLDRFRQLITEIGNAMGFIRMLRSGGLHALADEIKFVPNLQHTLALQDLTVEAGLSRETIEASRILDAQLSSMLRGFAEGSEFFPLLVSVFRTEFGLQANEHLANFYVIVPPLTINYVEHMLESKERLTKKNKDGATFTNDGFSMGLAFLLETLGLTAQFKALHWFRSVEKRYAEQEAAATEDSAKRRSKLERETALLTLNKLAVYRREFRLLDFTLSGASIFFKSAR